MAVRGSVFFNYSTEYSVLYEISYGGALRLSALRSQSREHVTHFIHDDDDYSYTLFD